MRQVVLDTETTGLEPSQGHRIIEIGCVELIDRRLTGKHFHQYLQPDRDIDEGAIEVHGITNEYLKDKPRFSDIVTDYLDFVRGAELIIHNAPFDVGFINTELKLLDGDWNDLEHYCSILDTLMLARKLHPGQKNSLDALCKRYSIDNSQRTLHKIRRIDPQRTPLRIIHASVEDLEQHNNYLEMLQKESDGKCVWNTIESLD